MERYIYVDYIYMKSNTYRETKMCMYIHIEWIYRKTHIKRNIYIEKYIKRNFNMEKHINGRHTYEIRLIWKDIYRT